MPGTTFVWNRQEPRSLARYVLSDLPAALALPPPVNRLDLLMAEGVRGLIAALYAQLVRQQINYDLAPFTPRAQVEQPIRSPHLLLAERRGTCLDLALALAGMCLANELLPLVVALEGHALLAVALTHTRRTADQAPGGGAFHEGMLTDVAKLQQWAADGRYALLECTGAAVSRASLDAAWPEGQGRDADGVMPFAAACQAGAAQITTHARARDAAPHTHQRAFHYALHIHSLQVDYHFAPVADMDGAPPAPPAAPPPAGRSHTQRIGGNARVGIAINGDVHGPVTGTNQGTIHTTYNQWSRQSGQVGGHPRPTAPGPTAPDELRALVQQVAAAQQQARQRGEGDLDDDLGDVLRALEQAVAARDGGRAERCREKLGQAHTLLTHLGERQPALLALVRRLAE